MNAAITSLARAIEDAAADLLKRLTKVVKSAKNEETIRITTEKCLAFLERDAGVTLDASHEFTVASGRIDSVYQRVIIEYKNPSSSSARIGTSASTAGSKKVIKQIKSRFADIEGKLGHGVSDLLGVGLDGRRFIFVRFRGGKWEVEDPVEVTQTTCERFLWSLFNLGVSGKPFSAEQLAADFGASSEVAAGVVNALYQSLHGKTSGKTQVFFKQWQILFREVCGFDVAARHEKIESLADTYGIARHGLRPADLLFALHSYYALFMKLLASEIVAFFHRLPTPLKKLQQAPTSTALLREVRDLEAGGIFRHLNITNFLEGDLFAWYPEEWSPDIESAIRKLASTLDGYNPGTLSLDPSGSRDLLKILYQELFPKSVRHDLGEYYTPDWLAEHVLDSVGFDGNPDTRLLDPACGSGTFLVMAINRVKEWYSRNRDSLRYREDDLCRKILNNFIGFDLNPLAVMAARTNVLIAIRGLIAHVDRIELPVFLCDSILTPIEHDDLFMGPLGRARRCETAVATFVIPTEVTGNRDTLSKYAEQLEQGVGGGYSDAEFLESCNAVGLSTENAALHLGLFNELQRLSAAKKNGVWARIVKNAFAPLFIDPVDFVVGNPPWINWESLPDDYRKATAPVWQQYNLFRHKGYKAKLGGAKDDISILFTYVCHDRYLKEGGKLGFVITQSVFKTKGGGEAFRSFRYPKDQTAIHLAPLSVHDFSRLQPFEGAANRTAVIVAGKSASPVQYPVRYTLWRKKPKTTLLTTDSMEQAAQKLTSTKLVAIPVSKSNLLSPWLTCTAAALSVIDVLRGTSEGYKSRKGVYCPTNAIYWVDAQAVRRTREILVTNLADTGKRSVAKVTQAVESDFVYALVRGRDVGRWSWHSENSILLPQRHDKPSKAVDEGTLKVTHPKTYAYFKQFEKDIRKCALLKQFFDPKSDPFYSVYNVGDYTFASCKVIWQEISKDITAAVVEGSRVVPDHKLVLVVPRSVDEGHFLCGVLNSSPIRLFVMSYAVQTSISGHIFDYAAIPSFDSGIDLHKRIAKGSRECHRAAASGNLKGLGRAEQAVDELAARLLGIDAKSLSSIYSELEQLEGSKKNTPDKSSTVDSDE